MGQNQKYLGLTGTRSIYMAGCQNCGPLLGPLNTRCRIILRTQKGSIFLTTTHIYTYYYDIWGRCSMESCKTDVALLSEDPKLPQQP